MGWEQRSAGNSYYYTKERVGNRVVSRYWGKGHIAEVFSSVDESRRYIKKLESNQAKAEKESQKYEFRETNQPIDEVLAKTYKLVIAILLITNHNCHKGQWRKSRIKAQLIKEDEEMQIPVCIDPNKDLDREFDLLLEKATGKKPDSQQVRDLRRFLRDHPEMWQQLSSLYDLTFNNFLNKELVDPVAIELLRPTLKDLKNKLGWDNASVLERLIIEGVILTYVRWLTTEFKHVDVVSQNHSFDRGVYWEKRLNNAQKAYLRACETLARIRKLSRNSPELQDDFSQQQKEMVM